MNHDGRALTERATEAIYKNVFNGIFNDYEIARLFDTIEVQRRVLRVLFNLFHAEPLKLIAVADPVRRSELNHLKELVNMEDRQ